MCGSWASRPEPPLKLAANTGVFGQVAPVRPIPGKLADFAADAEKRRRIAPTPLSTVAELLPAGLGDAGQFAAVSHVTEAHARDAELREHTTGTAVDGVAAA